MNRTEKATQYLTAAQTDLDAALAAGQDTQPARERLRLAQQELREAQEADARAQAAAQRSMQGSLNQAVATELKAAQANLDATLAALPSPGTPTASLNGHILERLVRARINLEATREAQTAHAAQLKDLDDRLHALTSERQAITTRRAGGGGNDAEDGPRLALLNADIDGLLGIIERTRAQAPTGMDIAATEVASLERRWREEQQEALVMALRRHCEALESNLLQAATGITDLLGPLGNTQMRWRPGQRLRSAVLSGIV